LCTKIIFTNVKNDSFFLGVKDYIKNNIPCHSIKGSEEKIEIELDADDEALYGVCVKLGEYVTYNIIKPKVNILLSSYDCFNKDESHIIWTNVLKCQPICEISGRMYVYLKVNKSIHPLGFMAFMCKDTVKNALEYARDEADKILQLNDRLNMIDTLKYFSDMSLESVEKVVLTANSGNVRIVYGLPEERYKNGEYAMDQADVLAELVTMNPEHIEIHGKEEFLKTDISSVIEAVFENRIEYK